MTDSAQIALLQWDWWRWEVGPGWGRGRVKPTNPFVPLLPLTAVLILVPIRITTRNLATLDYGLAR